jgi:hypothetical protein
MKQVLLCKSFVFSLVAYFISHTALQATVPEFLAGTDIFRDITYTRPAANPGDDEQIFTIPFSLYNLAHGAALWESDWIRQFYWLGDYVKQVPKVASSVGVSGAGAGEEVARVEYIDEFRSFSEVAPFYTLKTYKECVPLSYLIRVLFWQLPGSTSSNDFSVSKKAYPKDRFLAVQEWAAVVARILCVMDQINQPISMREGLEPEQQARIIASKKIGIVRSQFKALSKLGTNRILQAFGEYDSSIADKPDFEQVLLDSLAWLEAQKFPVDLLPRIFMAGVYCIFGNSQELITEFYRTLVRELRGVWAKQPQAQEYLAAITFPPQAVSEATSSKSPAAALAVSYSQADFFAGLERTKTGESILPSLCLYYGIKVVNGGVYRPLRYQNYTIAGQRDHTPDCIETVLRNIILALITDKGGNFIPGLVTPEFDAFFVRFGTRVSQASGLAHQAWGELVCNVPGVKYIHRTDGGYEFEVAPSVRNLIVLLDHVFGLNIFEGVIPEYSLDDGSSAIIQDVLPVLNKALAAKLGLPEVVAILKLASMKRLPGGRVDTSQPLVVASDGDDVRGKLLYLTLTQPLRTVIFSIEPRMHGEAVSFAETSGTLAEAEDVAKHLGQFPEMQSVAAMSATRFIPTRNLASGTVFPPLHQMYLYLWRIQYTEIYKFSKMAVKPSWLERSLFLAITQTIPNQALVIQSVQAWLKVFAIEGDGSVNVGVAACFFNYLESIINAAIESKNSPLLTMALNAWTSTSVDVKSLPLFVRYVTLVERSVDLLMMLPNHIMRCLPSDAAEFSPDVYPKLCEIWMMFLRSILARSVAYPTYSSYIKALINHLFRSKNEVLFDEVVSMFEATWNRKEIFYKENIAVYLNENFWTIGFERSRPLIMRMLQQGAFFKGKEHARLRVSLCRIFSKLLEEVVFAEKILLFIEACITSDIGLDGKLDPSLEDLIILVIQKGLFVDRLRDIALELMQHTKTKNQIAIGFRLGRMLVGRGYYIRELSDCINELLPRLDKFIDNIVPLLHDFVVKDLCIETTARYVMRFQKSITDKKVLAEIFSQLVARDIAVD